ncbi:MAG TPA: DUF3499 domain-containing protein [Actinomycetales bacterium]|nr:DUF3499 domain-containing protein [Actinomycetales bacterium]
MRPVRKCSKPACGEHAVVTLTYVYADSTAVLGPLATHAEPHTYDLCTRHSERLTAPRGWEVVRLAPEQTPAEPSRDELMALADAVREVAKSPVPEPQFPPPTVVSGKKGHLRLLRDPQ